MKKFRVYGIDSTSPLAEFDTINEAMVYARKHLRNNGRSHRITSPVYSNIEWSYWKANGQIKVRRIVLQNI